MRNSENNSHHLRIFCHQQWHSGHPGHLPHVDG
jgi:hypothetical protein